MTTLKPYRYLPFICLLFFFYAEMPRLIAQIESAPNQEPPQGVPRGEHPVKKYREEIANQDVKIRDLNVQNDSLVLENQKLQEEIDRLYELISHLQQDDDNRGYYLEQIFRLQNQIEYLKQHPGEQLTDQ